MRRMSYIQLRILNTLRQTPQQSYESLAATAECDRSSAIIGVRMLQHRGIVVLVQRGRGPTPNRYAVRE